MKISIQNTKMSHSEFYRMNSVWFGSEAIYYLGHYLVFIQLNVLHIINKPSNKQVIYYLHNI